MNTITKVKGEKNGLCNITACQSPHNVIWYNHGSDAYYCPTCAAWLNRDTFNKSEALKLFGHDLCTEDKT
jgi:hypothetical protein